VLDADGSSQFKWTQNKAQLSSSAKLVVPLCEHTKERVKKTVQRYELEE